MTEVCAFGLCFFESTGLFTVAEGLLTVSLRVFTVSVCGPGAVCVLCGLGVLSVAWAVVTTGGNKVCPSRIMTGACGCVVLTVALLTVASG